MQGACPLHCTAHARPLYCTTPPGDPVRVLPLPCRARLAGSLALPADRAVRVPVHEPRQQHGLCVPGQELHGARRRDGARVGGRTGHGGVARRWRRRQRHGRRCWCRRGSCGRGRAGGGCGAQPGGGRVSIGGQLRRRLCFILHVSCAQACVRERVKGQGRGSLCVFIISPAICRGADRQAGRAGLEGVQRWIKHACVHTCAWQLCFGACSAGWEIKVWHHDVVMQCRLYALWLCWCAAGRPLPWFIPCIHNLGSRAAAKCRQVFLHTISCIWGAVAASCVPRTHAAHAPRNQTTLWLRRLVQMTLCHGCVDTSPPPCGPLCKGSPACRWP